MGIQARACQDCVASASSGAAPGPWCPRQSKSARFCVASGWQAACNSSGDSGADPLPHPAHRGDVPALRLARKGCNAGSPLFPGDLLGPVDVCSSWSTRQMGPLTPLQLPRLLSLRILDLWTKNELELQAIGD